MLTWNASDYGDIKLMIPRSQDVFRPSIALLNTMGERDLFKEDDAPVRVHPDGGVSWFPGSIFHTACKLDLTHYPFDEQTCKLDVGRLCVLVV
ncbi:acetylcholine receptor subunit alpha [Elysia marginata]|uniref:Acetylcholine receptor subunit alpha n=1 Tax=Elysia marginata TaxID=1093978 RepID=A0AAV4FWB8_9GAST|nr:acetylcholine receptor subunit alpha [Elysia marginata]